MLKFMFGLILGSLITASLALYAHKHEPCNPNVDDQCPIQDVF